MQVDRNENNHYRGLHIVIFNPFSGVVESSKVFDTYKSSVEFNKFVDTEIPKGHIVAAACMDEGSAELSVYCKSWF